jgi:predicted transcriptional regulator
MRPDATTTSAATPRLHDLERAVMEHIWSAGECSVREVMDALNRPRKVERAYTTYMTIMSRLQNKGVLVRRRVGKTDYYRPAHTRADYISMQAQAEVEELVSLYGEVALSNFARQMAALDPARRRRLERQGRRSRGE